MKMRVRDTGEVVELAELGEEEDCPSECSFLCTLDFGHSGVHVGHGDGGPLAFWHDGDTRPTLVEPLEPTP